MGSRAVVMAIILLALVGAGLYGWSRSGEEELRFGPRLSAQDLAALEGPDLERAARLAIGRFLSRHRGEWNRLPTNLQPLHVLWTCEDRLSLQGVDTAALPPTIILEDVVNAYRAIGLPHYAITLRLPGSAEARTKAWRRLWRPAVSRKAQLAYLTTHRSALGDLP